MKKKKNYLIAVIVLVFLIVAISVYASTTSTTAETDISLIKETEYTVKNGSISISVSESGSVNPTDKRVIKSEIDGTVEEIFVTEGDVVEKDQMLISTQPDTATDSQNEIDSINLNIKRAQKELNDLYNNQGDLYIYAPTSGVISNLDIETGDEIKANNNIATITDTDNSYIEVYFNKSQFDKISVGDDTSVFMSMYFATEGGTVSEKNSTPVQMGGGISGYLVTIKITNPGGYSIGDIAQVTVTNSHGSFEGLETGKIVETETKQVISNIDGEVMSINTKNGQYVNKGDIIATIAGDDLNFEIAEKQNTINSYKSKMEDLVEGDTIYSPMKGTILKVDVSEEEVVERTTSLMTVADLDNMEVVIAVDELDVDKIELDQQAYITCDVYPDEKITGKVTKISLEGTNNSGVTTYDVTIKLDDRKSLMSGMNVDVEIIADGRDDVLVIPIDAIQKIGGEYIVTVKNISGNKSEVKVKLGLATEDLVEITSGLSIGDVIVYDVIQSESSKEQIEMGVPGMGGGPVGGMPGRGTPGGGPR